MNYFMWKSTLVRSRVRPILPLARPIAEAFHIQGVASIGIRVHSVRFRNGHFHEQNRVVQLKMNCNLVSFLETAPERSFTCKCSQFENISFFTFFHFHQISCSDTICGCKRHNAVWAYNKSCYKSKSGTLDFGAPADPVLRIVRLQKSTMNVFSEIIMLIDNRFFELHVI